MNKLIKEDLAPFKLEKEKQRIWDVLSIMETIEYGFINQRTGERVTDRDWIHHNDLTDIYKTNADPLITLKNKLGICKDQAILFKFLMNKFHPEDNVFLYAVSTNIQGHCQPAYCHEGLWFMNDSSWDREHRLHGPFNSQEELEDYLNYVYYMNHKEDNDLESRDEVEVEELDKEQLLEDTRAQLVSKSKNADPYKNTKYGKNRFERKKYSKVANTVKEFNNINMDELFKRDILIMNATVAGETGKYMVQVKMEGVVAEIAKNIKNNNNIFEFKTVIQAITKVFNSSNIQVHCSCDDFKYRYQHALIVSNDNVDGTDKDPGPGKTGMANSSGKGCKHILLVLNNSDWIMKVASVIRNYINYFAEHRKPAFNKLIFPKLYGVPFDAAAEENLVPDEESLETNESIIDIINDWAKNRGKAVKGSTVNPAKGKSKIQGPAEQEEKKEGQ